MKFQKFSSLNYSFHCSREYVKDKTGQLVLENEEPILIPLAETEKAEEEEYVMQHPGK